MVLVKISIIHLQGDWLYADCINSFVTIQGIRLRWLSLVVCQVGISVYHQPLAWIQRCVLSALNQSCAIDLIFTLRIDGPSACDADSRKWLLDLGKRDDRVCIVEGCDRLGAFGSYREIFSESNSTYLCQLDADDWLEINAISESVNCLNKNPSAPFSYSRYREVDSEGNYLQEGRRSSSKFIALAEVAQFSTFHFRVIRRSAYRKCGGYRSDLEFTGDYDLCLKLAEFGEPVAVHKILYNYRIHGSNASILYNSSLDLEALSVSQEALSRRKLLHIYDLRQVSVSPKKYAIYPKSGPYLIAGMHKSGTSITSLILRNAGLDFGPTLLQADSDNPDGYIEDIDSIQINRLALARKGKNPEWGFKETDGTSCKISYSEWLKLAVDFLDQRRSFDSYWGWKDPRNSLLLEEWLEVDPSMKVVAVFREPWDVLASLGRSRHNFFYNCPSKAVEIWCNFNRKIIEFKIVHSDRLILVHTNTLLANPHRLFEVMKNEWHCDLSEGKGDSGLFSADLIRSNRFLSIDRFDASVIDFTEKHEYAMQLYGQLNELADIPFLNQ